MIKIENVEVVGWEHVIRGMRNPMNSWDRSDSCMCKINNNDCYVSTPCGCPKNGEWDDNYYCIGVNDFDLMKKLSNAGTDHRKFMRMIVVYADFTAPLYWWKEFDTYKVGTVRNSCSTMHKITEKEFTREDFSHEHLEDMPLMVNTAVLGGIERYNIMGSNTLDVVIATLNNARLNYLKGKENGADDNTLKRYWWQIIQLLPSSYNQRATVMLNYEVLANMYHSRKNHKLDEWVEFCKWIESLPYSEIIVGGV